MKNFLFKTFILFLFVFSWSQGFATPLHESEHAPKKQRLLTDVSDPIQTSNQSVTTSQDLISQLPLEIAHFIFKHLDKHDLLAASQVSKNWRTLSNDAFEGHKYSFSYFGNRKRQDLFKMIANGPFQSLQLYIGDSVSEDMVTTKLNKIKHLVIYISSSKYTLKIVPSLIPMLKKLKSLNLVQGILFIRQHDKLDSSIFESLKNLMHLALGTVYVSPAEIKLIFDRLPLESFEFCLNDNWLQNDAKVFTAFKSLKNLTVNGTYNTYRFKATSDFIQSLTSPLNRIEMLKIIAVDFPINSFSCLSNKQSLTHLEIDGGDLSPDDMISIRKCSNLNTLMLCASFDLHHLSGHESLTNLTINKGEQTKDERILNIDEFQAIGSYSKLQSLTISETKFDVSHFQILSKLQNLTTLDIEVFSEDILDQYYLLSISRLPKLNYLRINDLSDDLKNYLSFDNFKNHKNLTELNVSGIKIKADDIQTIRSCLNLKRLTLDGNEFEPVNLMHLAGHENLRSLILAGNTLNLNDLLTLSNELNLNNLSCEGNAFLDTRIELGSEHCDYLESLSQHSRLETVKAFRDFNIKLNEIAANVGYVQPH